MPNPMLYERYKAEGVCVTARNHGLAVPGRVYCTPCLEKKRQRVQDWRDAQQHRDTRLAHCGAWHVITTLPLTCPACGHAWEETP